MAIQGKDAVLEIFVTDGYYPILCAIDFTLATEPEFITKTGPTSGLFREFQKRIEGWSVQLNGLTKVENGTTISWFYLIQTAVRRAVQQIRITFTDSEGDTMVFTGSVLIGAQTITGPVSGFSQAAVEFKGTGGYELDTVIDPPAEQECEVEDTLYLTLAEGATSVTDALLTATGVVILGVSRSGQVHSETTGTPFSLEFVFTTGTGTISFDPTNPGNAGGEPVTVEYKIENP